MGEGVTPNPPLWLRHWSRTWYIYTSDECRTAAKFEQNKDWLIDTGVTKNGFAWVAWLAWTTDFTPTWLIAPEIHPFNYVIVSNLVRISRCLTVGCPKWKKVWTYKSYIRRRRGQDSNLCGNIPFDFESNALTTRPPRHLKFGSYFSWLVLRKWRLCARCVLTA